MIDGLISRLAELPPESTQQAVGYPSVFLLVTLGALVPVVPTGAVVSSAAVVAFHQTSPLSMVYVFLVAAFSAFLGDVALYWLGKRGVGSKNGSRWLAALRRRCPARPAGAGPAQAARARGDGAGALPAGARRADSGDAGLSARGLAAAPVRPG